MRHRRPAWRPLVLSSWFARDQCTRRCRAWPCCSLSRAPLSSATIHCRRSLMWRKSSGSWPLVGRDGPQWRQPRCCCCRCHSSPHGIGTGTRRRWHSASMLRGRSWHRHGERSPYPSWGPAPRRSWGTSSRWQCGLLGASDRRRETIEQFITTTRFLAVQREAQKLMAVFSSGMVSRSRSRVLNNSRGGLRPARRHPRTVGRSGTRRGAKSVRDELHRGGK